MMSIAEFADVCNVSRAAIYKAGNEGHIRFFRGANGGRLVDETLSDSRAYRSDVSRQRHQARQDKASGFGIYARGGHKRSHRRGRTIANPARQPSASTELQTVDLCSLIPEWWNAGGLPRGWAALCLADVPDPDVPGKPTPLYFYPPPDGENIFESDVAKDYTVDLEADPVSVAIGEDGTRHSLVLKTYGRVRWLSARTSRGRKPRKSGGGERSSRKRST